MRIPALIALLSANPAFADITVTFAEGAPTDRFTIAANDSCVTGPVQMTIDLSESDAGLVFDVTAAGAGVEVFSAVCVGIRRAKRYRLFGTDRWRHHVALGHRDPNHPNRIHNRFGRHHRTA